ncbi:aldehyde dehydrogenase (NADP(+)) [Sphingomonas oryzagri]
MNIPQGRSFRGFEAATGKAIGPDFPVSVLSDVEAACAAADAAFNMYRETRAEDRAGFLETIAEEIMALGDALIERAALESGLPVARLTGERGRTVGQLRLFADVVRSGLWRGLRVDPAQPDRSPFPRPDLRLRMIPLGPVAVFGASNFPLAFSTAGGDTASALAAGCPVIVKGHPAHPGTHMMISEAITRAVVRCGLPAGVFSQISGPGVELGSVLVGDPRICAVGFTGSRPGGLALVRLAQARVVPIPVYAEMSSINPVLLLPGALQDRSEALASGFVGSLTLAAGQFCTNPGLVLAIDGPDLEKFERAAADMLATHQPQTMLTAGIRSAYEDATEARAAHPEVAEIATGFEGDGRTMGTARLYATSADAFLSDAALAGEIFGAASIVVRCRNLEQMKQVVHGLEGQLTATIHLAPEDERVAAEIIPSLERRAGRILVGGWPTGVEVAHAMVHGGPYPATSDGRSTSVGSLAIDRFLRPVCYQDLPSALLPAELREDATEPRLLDGVLRL